jgi:hypothetical protein
MTYDELSPSFCDPQAVESPGLIDRAATICTIFIEIESQYHVSVQASQLSRATANRSSASEAEANSAIAYVERWPFAFPLRSESS